MANQPSPICFRLSADERDRIELAATVSGRSLSSFVRDAALRLADECIRENQPRIELMHQEQLAALEAEQRKWSRVLTAAEERRSGSRTPAER